MKKGEVKIRLLVNEGNPYLFMCFGIFNFFILLASLGVIGIGIYLLVLMKG